MQSATQPASVSNTPAAPTSKKMLWTGRILLFDSGIKIMKLAPAVEGTARLGYPVSLVFGIGIVLLVCVVLCDSAYLRTRRNLADRLSRRRCRFQPARQQPILRLHPFPCLRCRAPLGRTLPPRPPPARAHPAAHSEGGPVEFDLGPLTFRTRSSTPVIPSAAK